MVKPKGGKGHPAPYETTHVRVPIPIKDRVEKIIEEYRLQLLVPESTFSEKHPEPLPLEDAKKAAKQILKHKKSARQSLTKLLTAIYSIEVTKDSLI